jgi:endonuclease/exonuclease/phosphatase family metal-dependent hydrolase
LAIALTLASACGGGGGSKSITLHIVNQNILHGIGDEDPAAEPFDRYAERIELFADAVRADKPDVVLLQEVVGSPGPDYPDTRAILLDALGPGYSAVFGNFLGEEIDGPGLGQMTFSSLPVLSSENRSVSEIRAVHHVAVQSGLGVVDLYNVHLEGTGAVLDVTQDGSIVEIQNVLAFINETRSGSGPVILTGDFNAEPQDPSIQRVLAANYIDALAAGGDATCEQQGDPGCSSGTIPLGDNSENLTDHRIDYIFVLAGDAVDIEIESAGRYQDEPVDIGGGRLLWVSDHIGVQAVVRLREQ